MINFKAPLLDQYEKPLKDGLDGGSDLTLGRAAANALFAAYPDERDLPAEEKWARAELAMRLLRGDAVELTAEEVAKVKKLIGKCYSGLVIMRAYPLLDPAAMPPKIT